MVSDRVSLLLRHFLFLRIVQSAELNLLIKSHQRSPQQKATISSTSIMVAKKIRNSIVPPRELSPSPVEKSKAGTDITEKYRGLINRHLASIGKQWGASLELNHRGLCHFQCGTFVLVIEVPWDSKNFFLYTSIMKCLPSSAGVMCKALELNYMMQATRSCTLALAPKATSQDMEISLYRSQRIDGTSPLHIITLVRGFLQTASSVQKHLHRAQRTKLSMIKPSLPRRPKSDSPNRRHKRSKSNKPPPPPRARDMTPTISNKTVDKGASRRSIHQNKDSRTVQRIPSLTELTKAKFALGLTVVAATRGYEYPKSAPRSASVMRRISRMASKTLPRPRANFGRGRNQPKAILATSQEEEEEESSFEPVEI